MEIRSSWTNRLILVCAVVAILGTSFYLGYIFGENRGEASAYVTNLDTVAISDQVGSSTKEKIDMALFWKAWKLVNEKYAQTHKGTPASTQDRVYGAIKGMVASMGDPYTVFFTPSETTAFNTEIDGNFEGVGMEMGIKDGFLTVISALPNTPAMKAGMKSGDKVLKIDEKFTSDISIDEAVKLIRGAKGTPVVFTVLRADSKAPFEVKVIRDTITLPTLDTSFDSQNKIFTIKLYNFSAQSADLFRQALRKFIEADTNKLIIDLRGNPGGYLDAAVSMASWFLPTGEIIVKENYGEGKGESVERSLGYNIFNDNLRLVILVDGGSASAAEILAGALSEHGKAKLVGEKTFGKGSVQEYMQLDSKTGIKITVARWLTPKGKSISEEGLMPDVKVPITAENIKNSIDPQMAAAVEILSK